MTDKEEKKLIKVIKKIHKSECDTKNTKLEYVKENNEIYLVSFEPLSETTGSQDLFKIDKKTLNYDLLFLPSPETFSLLDSFENKEAILKDKDIK